MFRQKEERFIYTEAGDAYNTDNVLKYLGKTIPVCPYTGSTTDVVKFPVDFNQQNSIPSNMHHISKSALSKEGDILMMDLVMWVNNGPIVTVTFYAPTFVLEKALPEAESIISKFNESDKSLLQENKTEAIYAIWDTLIFNNVKGIFGVKTEYSESSSKNDILVVGGGATKQSVSYYAEAQFVMGKISAKMMERSKLSPTSKIQL